MGHAIVNSLSSNSFTMSFEPQPSSAIELGTPYATACTEQPAVTAKVAIHDVAKAKLDLRNQNDGFQGTEADSGVVCGVQCIRPASFKQCSGGPCYCGNQYASILSMMSRPSKDQGRRARCTGSFMLRSDQWRRLVQICVDSVATHHAAAVEYSATRLSLRRGASQFACRN